MSKAEAKRADGDQAANVARGLRESALWIFGALALILFASLVSYDRADPAFSSTGQPGPVTNLNGPVGAWLSDLFFVLFGGPAFLFPIMLGFAGFSLYRERRSKEPIDRRATALRGVGFVLALASSCGLATLHFPDGSLPNTAGGLLGSLVGLGLDHALGLLGATLLLLAIWFGSVALFTGISWFDVMDRIGSAALAGIAWIKDRLLTARDVKAGREVKQARQEVVREEQKRRRSASRRGSSPLRPRSRRASASRRKSRSRCSSARAPRNSLRSRCSMTRRRARAATRPRRSRRCRASSS